MTQASRKPQDGRLPLAAATTRSMGLVAALTALCLTTAHADTLTKCITSEGHRLEAVVRNGRAIIRHDEGKWYPARTDADERTNLGTITQYGRFGTMVLTAPIQGGKSRIDTTFRTGRKVRLDAMCTHRSQ